MVRSFTWLRFINGWYCVTGLKGFVSGSICPDPPSMPGRKVRVLLGARLNICFIFPRLSAAPTWTDLVSITFKGALVGRRLSSSMSMCGSSCPFCKAGRPGVPRIPVV